MCFDDVQLERVCEYPSEDSALAFVPYSPHPGPEDGGRRGGEQEEDEEEEEETRSGMNESAGRVRFLKVGQWLQITSSKYTLINNGIIKPYILL